MKGGHNKETFMLSVKTFKSLCLKAGTKKADETHEYYIKLEETLHEAISEESDELKMQLENKNIQLNQEKKQDRKPESRIAQEGCYTRQSSNEIRT